MNDDQTIVDFRPGKKYTPEQELWYQVIQQAMEDAFEISTPSMAGRPKDVAAEYATTVREARDFFERNDGVPGTGKAAWTHFECVCYAAGLDPSFVDRIYYNKKNGLDSSGNSLTLTMVA